MIAKLLISILLVAGGIPAEKNQSGWQRVNYKPLPVSMRDIKVYHSSTCGCCKMWLSHLKQHGFNVTSIEKSDMQSIKQKFNLPKEMQSCHTAIIQGYIIEGHVPASDIVRLVREKPGVLGISVPGMPVGTPGMEYNNQKDKFDVIAFKKDGTQTVFNRYERY